MSPFFFAYFFHHINFHHIFKIVYLKEDRIDSIELRRFFRATSKDRRIFEVIPKIYALLH